LSRVVISGLGLHSAAGDLAATWTSLALGQSHIRDFTLPSSVGMSAIPACPSAPINLSGFLGDPKLQKYMNGATAMAVLASGRALASGGILNDQARCKETALYFSTGLIPFDVTEALPALRTELDSLPNHDWEKLSIEAKAFRRCNPLLPFKMLLNMPLGLVSIVFGLGGENSINYPGAQQSAVNLEIVHRGITSNRFFRAIAGASAQQLSLGPILTAVQSGCAAASPHHYHQGFALADSAASLLIENENEAINRGVSIRAYLARVNSIPFGSTDPTHLESNLVELLDPFDGLKPEAIVATGFRNSEDFMALRKATQTCWGLPTPSVFSFDSKLGFGGAAALTMSIALACHWLGGAKLPENTAICTGGTFDKIERLVVISQDLDGALGATLLLAPERVS
jgi:3-oxoacyl-(acyl-carrier-protein) synthase